MSGSSSQPDVFDVRRIRRLVALMEEHDLNEIDLRQGEMRIQLRRGESQGGMPAVLPTPRPQPSPPSAPPAPSAEGAAAQPDEQDHVALIRSPMVGTFYAAPDPESPPFVKVGDHVGPETTVCIVEAMKVFNQIPSEVSGRIMAVLVENGEPVEYGQPLFRVDTRG